MFCDLCLSQFPRMQHLTQLMCSDWMWLCSRDIVHLGLVFFGSVVFVCGDVVHQVSLLILVFITVLWVLQEVKCLQNVTWTPEHKNTQLLMNSVEYLTPPHPVTVWVCEPFAVLPALCPIYQVLQILVLHWAVLLGARQAEQRANPLSTNVQDGVCVAYFLQVPENTQTQFSITINWICRGFEL